MSEIQEYTDEATGMRLTIEHDGSEHPRIMAYAPENAHTFTIEALNEGIQRLIVQAKADGHLAEKK